MHDRFLTAPLDTPPTPYECFHYSRAAALLSVKLTKPLDKPSRNAVWSTAVLLAHSAFFSTDASSAATSWPLAADASSAQHLAWLTMQDGMRILWPLAEPVKPGGLFYALAQQPAQCYLCYLLEPTWTPGIEGIPSNFVQLCELTEASTAENNDYHAAVRNLVPLLSMQCGPETLVRLTAFTSLMPAAFKKLLGEKDLRALLILSCWYAKMCAAPWWIARRAVVECQAICLYIERECTSRASKGILEAWEEDRGRDLMLEMLQFPMLKCGLVDLAASELNVASTDHCARSIDADILM